MRVLFIIALAPLIGAMNGCSNDTPPQDSTPLGDLEARRQHIKDQETKVSDEAQGRKDRSHAILKFEKIQFNEHLPLIETESESTHRTTEQVAERAMALCIVAVKGEGLEQEIIDKLIVDYELTSAFSPKEKEFIYNPNPSQRDRIQFAWRYECYWVMLWALGFVDTLERPDKVCDVRLAVSLLREHGREGFLKKARLRPRARFLMPRI